MTPSGPLSDPGDDRDEEPEEGEVICVCGHYFEEHERWEDDVLSCAIEDCVAECADFQEARG